jgi:glycosyltransferase involved in cell wall biosynthesis
LPLCAARKGVADLPGYSLFMLRLSEQRLPVNLQGIRYSDTLYDNAVDLYDFMRAFREDRPCLILLGDAMAHLNSIVCSLHGVGWPWASCKLGVGISLRIHVNRKLRIAVDCRIENSQQGVGTAVLALAKALSESAVADQEYTFIVCQDMLEWLKPYTYGPCKLAGIPGSKLSKVKAAFRWFAPLRFLWRKVRRRMVHIPVSDGYVEAQQFDVIHFPTQAAYLTDLPSIYQPHDLQHLHYPEFFSTDEFNLREMYYRTFCDRASYVCVHAEWTKQDLIEHYGLPSDKVVVIPWGVVFDAYTSPSSEAMLAAVEKYRLPEHFFFYPAVTWPHKNHEVILRALYILKEKHGRTPSLYLTGATTKFRTTIDSMALALGLHEQVHHLGFVATGELQAIYRMATAMVYASKFEGFGLPLLEAFQAGLPVLSSNATVLPEIAQDGALYFDPNSPEQLTQLMLTMLDDEQARRRLIGRGAKVLSQYSFARTAAEFQALYVRTASRSTDRDHLAVEHGRPGTP